MLRGVPSILLDVSSTSAWAEVNTAWILLGSSFFLLEVEDKKMIYNITLTEYFVRYL